MRHVAGMALIAVFGLLAGCTNSPGGQSIEGDGFLAYNGASPGQHDDEFRCDGQGQVHATANVGMGSLDVKVYDAAGSIAYTKRLSSPSQLADSSEAKGKAGEWRVVVERGGSGGIGTWSGQYEVHVAC